MKATFTCRPSRHVLDTLIGLLISTDYCNILHDDQTVTTFSVRITLCLVWLNLGVTIYL